MEDERSDEIHRGWLPGGCPTADMGEIGGFECIVSLDR